MTEAPARTVFVVDYDPSVRTSLARILRSAGLCSRTFEDATQFLNERDTSSEGCLILDLDPLSGQALMARLSEAETHLPLIVLSGSDDDESRRAARRLGARFFFHKPVDGQALLDAVAWLDPSSPSPNGAAGAHPGTSASG